MAHREQKALVSNLSEKHSNQQKRIRDLSEDRSDFLSKILEDAGGLKDSLDQRLYETVKSQADKAG